MCVIFINCNNGYYCFVFIFKEVKPGEILAFEDILNFNGANLSIGYHEEGHKAVQDFSQFHVLKQLYFRKLLVDQKYFQTAAAQGEPPSFVAMAGEIVSILMTPFTKWERWGFYGVRYEDVIFLYNSIPEKRLAETIQGYAGKVYKVSNYLLVSGTLLYKGSIEWIVSIYAFFSEPCDWWKAKGQ